MNGSVRNKVEEAFAPDGLFVQSGRSHRPGQLVLALAIAQGFDEKRCVMVEGAVGLGKSLGYLAAAVLAASKGRRVCIAVGTNNLIEQIRADIPEVMRVLGVSINTVSQEYITTAVLKGRANYTCGHRMRRARDMVSTRMQRLTPQELAQFIAVRDWHYADEDANFDLTLHEQTLTSRVRNLITNDADGCRRDRKKGCDWNENPKTGQELRCPMLLARRNALEGEIVVTNFNVYLFNCKLRGGLMGEFDTVILDESHEFPNKIRDFFAVEWSMRVFSTLVERVSENHELSKAVSDAIMPALIDAVSELDTLLRDTAIGAMIQNPPARDARDFDMLLEPGADYQTRLLMIVSRIYVACVQIVKAASLAGIPPEIVEMDFDKRQIVKRLAEGLGGAFDGKSFVPGQHESNFAISLQYGPLGPHDYDKEPHVSLSVIPVHLGGYMRQTIHYSKVREAAIASANNDPALVSAAIQQHSLSTHSDANVILVSATLTPDGTWDHPKHAFAMPADTIYCQVGSPFDYGKNALWYIPSEMPESNSANRMTYNDAATARARELVTVMGGRTLILCSRRADMRVAADAIRGLGFQVFMQDDAPPRELTRRFKADPSSCLIGSKTFGTGFDVPGNALECVIVWSMPYGKPTAVDELLRQRIGRSKWMNGVYTPAALLDYRQWIGRLLRTATDIGVIAFLDQRKYSALARQLHGAMPEGIPLVRRVEQVQQFMNERRGR